MPKLEFGCGSSKTAWSRCRRSVGCTQWGERKWRNCVAACSHLQGVSSSLLVISQKQLSMKPVEKARVQLSLLTVLDCQKSFLKSGLVCKHNLVFLGRPGLRSREEDSILKRRIGSTSHQIIPTKFLTALSLKAI